jgi:hypothetical protein
MDNPSRTGVLFITGLISGIIVLFLLDTYVKDVYKMNGPKHLVRGIYPYTYLGGYALIMGSILFIGLGNMKHLLQKYLGNPEITAVVTTSIVTLCGFIYMAYIQSIIEEIYRVKIEPTPWDNVIGYTVGRSIIILILVIIYSR